MKKLHLVSGNDSRQRWSAYIVPDGNRGTVNPEVRDMMFQWGFDLVNSIKEADAVVFTGGPDLDPVLFNQMKEEHNFSAVGWSDIARDYFERTAYHLSEGKLRIGICRGAQLLNLMNGGHLWLDVDQHRVSHRLRTSCGKTFMSASRHHQMMLLPSPQKVEYDVLASAYDVNTKAPFVSKMKRRMDMKTGDIKMFKTILSDPEVVWFPGSRSLCIQGHPESSLKPPAVAINQNTDINQEFREYCFNLVMERIAHPCAA